jgi:hypothetical protein
MTDTPANLSPDDLPPEQRALYDQVYGEHGPVQSALGFLRELAGRRDVLAAWRLADANFRLCAAQDWVWVNRDALRAQGIVDLDGLAAALALPDAAHPLWPSFAGTQLHSLSEAFPWLDPEHLGVTSRPRLIGPDLELVVFVREKDTGMYSEPTPLTAFRVVMRHSTAGWTVAGLCREDAPRPGWPPT